MRLASTCSMLALLLLSLGCVASKTKPAPEPPAMSIAVDSSFQVEAPKMIVGDSWHAKAVEEGDWPPFVTETVTTVNPDGSFETEEQYDGGDKFRNKYNSKYQLISAYNVTKDREDAIPNPPVVRYDFPLYVGKEWKDSYIGPRYGGGKDWYKNEYKVLDYQEITIDGKAYRAFKIKRTHMPKFGNWVDHETYWYCPETKSGVRTRPSWRYGSDLISFTPGKQ